jgi:hypothetical protein
VVSVDGPDGRYPKALDCGIAMLHFELGALTNGGVGGWELLEAPDVARYHLAEAVSSTSETDSGAVAEAQPGTAAAEEVHRDGDA